MANNALITFKAGRCELVSKRVTPDPQPGYIYVFIEDELPHFCWRPRSTPATEPTIDLLALPGDVEFEPLLREEGADDLHSPTNGRVYVLRFASSGERHFFYLQSKSQHSNGDPSWFSERDQRLGQIVNSILQGEDVDVENEIAELRDHSGPGGGSRGGDEMELDEPDSGNGGAGADATGGDARQEGEANREGGADGGRANTRGQSTQTSALVQDFLRSMNQSGAQQSKQQYTTLSDLLTSSMTISFLQTATSRQVDELCSFLPADLFLLAQESSTTTESNELSNLSSKASTDATAAIAALSTDQKKAIIARVLRSPQLQQSLGSLTIALRDGGLPMIGEALRLDVEHGGFVRGGSMPLEGAKAVRGFVEGVKRTIEGEENNESKMEE